jgi:hypothetical protein
MADEITMRVAGLHEDDYCHIEIVPAANWEHIQEEFVRLDAFSRAHEAPDGFGWTAMYRPAAPPVPLASLYLAPGLGSFRRGHGGRGLCAGPSAPVRRAVPRGLGLDAGDPAHRWGAPARVSGDAEVGRPGSDSANLVSC